MDSGLAGSQCMVEAYKRVERAIWNGGVDGDGKRSIKLKR